MKAKKHGIGLDEYFHELGRSSSDSIEQLHAAMNATLRFIAEERAALKTTLKIPIGFVRDPETKKLGIKWREIIIEKASSKRMERLRNQQLLIRTRIKRLRIVA